MQAYEDYRSVDMKAHTAAHTCVHIIFRRSSVHLQVNDKVYFEGSNFYLI